MKNNNFFNTWRKAFDKGAVTQEELIYLKFLMTNNLQEQLDEILDTHQNARKIFTLALNKGFAPWA